MEVKVITEKSKVQPDPVMKDYWRNNRRFADLINGCLFEGEQVIHAEDLAAYDTDESTIISGRGEKKMTILRNRDILKMCVPEAGFVLIGIENQQKVHGYMPLRIAVYDILDYVKQQRQWEETAGQESNQKKGRARQKKETKLKLIPVYSLVVYYGESEWKEAQSLWDMMDVPEYMKPYINNWYCRVIQVRSYNREFFKDPEVYSFFEACQQLYRVKGDLSALKGIRLTKETAAAVGTVTGSRQLIELAETEGGEVDMCMALDNLINEKVSEGKREGRREGKLEACISLLGQGLISVSAAAQVSGLTEEEVQQELKRRKGSSGLSEAEMRV